MEASAGTPQAVGGQAVGRHANQQWLRRQPMITVAAAAMAGVISADAPQRTIWIVGAAVVAAVVGLWYSRRHRRWRWLTAMACVAAAYGLHAQLADHVFRTASIASLATTDWQPVIVRGAVCGAVERRPDALARIRGANAAEAWQSVFDLRLTAVRAGSVWRPVSGGARVIVSGDVTHLLPGDRLQILGHLQSIAPPGNPGELDLRPIYRARHQQVRMLVDDAQQIHIHDPPSWTPARVLAALGTTGEQALLQHLGPRQGPLAAALVLGRREAVDAEQRELLLQTGTAHLLSVSGLHLGLVALAVHWLLVLLGLPRRQQIVIILVACVLYAALTGGRPPVLRAALLVAAVLAGLWMGRPIHPLGALAVAAVVLLTLNPANLTQVGVQLSFLAVGTLLLVGQGAATAPATDPLDRLIESRRSRLHRQLWDQLARLRSAARISFWVWAVTTPLVWYQFHIVSPISILANVVLSVPLTVSLISGLCTVVVAAAFPMLAAVFGWVCGRGLDLMMLMIDALAQIPYGHCWLPAPTAGWVLVFYAALVAGWMLPGRWPRARLALAWMVVWCLGGWWLVYERSRAPAGAVEATFVDVGHGTAVMIRHPTAGTWLYDCGRLGDPARSAQPIEGVLWHAGIYHLDGVILSHADADHYNALPDLLRRFRIDRIVTPPGMLDTDEPGLEAVRRAIAASNVPVVWRAAGSAVPHPDGPAWARVLHPPPQRVAGNDNANSLVVRIDHGGRTLLLPGDLEHAGTDALLHCDRPPPGGVLMAPHHGSLQQDLRPLLDWCRPAEVVVSGGRRADRPEVRQALSQTGARVHLTASDGAVRVRIDSQGRVTVQSYRDTPW